MTARSGASPGRRGQAPRPSRPAVSPVSRSRPVPGISTDFAKPDPRCAACGSFPQTVLQAHGFAKCIFLVSFDGLRETRPSVRGLRVLPADCAAGPRFREVHLPCVLRRTSRNQTLSARLAGPSRRLCCRPTVSRSASSLCPSADFAKPDPRCAGCGSFPQTVLQAPRFREVHLPGGLRQTSRNQTLGARVAGPSRRLWCRPTVSRSTSSWCPSADFAKPDPQCAGCGSFPQTVVQAHGFAKYIFLVSFGGLRETRAFRGRFEGSGGVGPDFAKPGGMRGHAQEPRGPQGTRRPPLLMGAGAPRPGPRRCSGPCGSSTGEGRVRRPGCGRRRLAAGCAG